MKKLSPLWLGIAIAGSLLAALFFVEILLGRLGGALVDGEFDALARVEGGVLRDLRIAIVHCLVMGYLPAALLHLVRSGQRTVRRLKDTLDCTPEECEALAASIRPGAIGLAVTGIIGLALSFIPPYLIAPVPAAPWDPASWTPEVAWHRVLGPLIGVLLWWLGYVVVIVSLRLSRIASRLERIDLLDLSPLAPFTRQGTTNALLLIGLLSIWSLMLLETGFGQMMVIICTATFILVAMAVLAPLRGVHRKISDTKQSELRWIGREIAKRREALKDGSADMARGEMADLAAYRGLVEAVPEWPLSTSAYLRLALYALIPIASWSLGVVAEALVDRVLF